MKAKTYTEFLEKKGIVDKLEELITAGKNPSEVAIVPNKMLSFDVGYTISLRERARITRKARRARKPRSVKLAVKRAAKQTAK